MKNDWVEAKIKNHFRVMRVGRSFCFCSSFLFYIPFFTKGFLINKGKIWKKSHKKTLSRLYIIEFENYKRWTCSKSNSHKYIKRLKFWFFRHFMCWGIQGSIIITEESWITFVLPLPDFDVFDSDHFLKKFESKLFII